MSLEEALRVAIKLLERTYEEGTYPHEDRDTLDQAMVILVQLYGLLLRRGP